MIKPAQLTQAVSGTAVLIAATLASGALAQNAPQLEAPAQNSAAYRDHVATVTADENWYEVERRGYQAQRGRPNFEVRKLDDLTVYEQRDLDRSGRIAQRKRGKRLPTQLAAKQPLVTQRMGTQRTATQRTATQRTAKQRASSPMRKAAAQSYTRTAAPARGPAHFNQYPGTARLQAGMTNRGKPPPAGFHPSKRHAAGYKAFNTLSKASNLDLGAQMFGGRDVGATRFASDMTVGQFSNALSGGDPIASAGHSARRFGRNMQAGLTGIGQSIRDPRRIPGNIGRAVEGTGRAAVDTTRFVGETAVKTLRDSGRIVTDPRFAKKQVRKAGKAVSNVGKSVCKGASYLIPGLSKKTCK